LNGLELLKNIGFNDFISLDLETTGLNISKDEIIEISAIHFRDGEVFDEFTTLIKPSVNIPKKITEITGITDSLVSDSPSIDSVFDKFLNFIDDSIIVAHNIDFDIGFIKKYAANNEKTINIKASCDTLLLSRSFLFFLDKFNLEYLSSEFGFNHKNAHRARIDALNTGKLLISLIHQISAIPLSVIEQINKIYQNRDIHNSLLYKNIFKMFKKYSNIDISPSKEFEVKNNILFSKKGNNKTFIENNIDDWFLDNGILSEMWKDYSKRENQINLSNDIYSNFKNQEILIAEAGAGLGKSLSYLISGLSYSKKNNKTLIVSTYTKTLQEQLFNKDIPIFTNALNLDLKAVILKGKNNYISKNKLNKIINNEYNYMEDKDIFECITLIVWSYFTKTGDVEECNGFDKQRINQLWAKLASSNESPESFFDENDYYNRIIKESKNADIIIVNHSLLCSDLSSKNSILPDDSILVIDEGHNLVSSIRNHLTNYFSDSNLIGLYYSFKKNIDFLKTKISDEISFQELNKSENNTQKILMETINIFNDFKGNYNDVYSNLEFNSYDLSITSEECFFNGLDLENLISILNRFNKEIEKADKLYKSNFQLELIKFSLSEIIDIIKIFLDNKQDYIKWISLYKRNLKNYVSLYNSDINIKNFIFNKINKKFPSFFLCSATLTINDSFSFFLSDIGINDNLMDSINTKIYKSPFYYDEQSKFYVLNKKIEINSDSYITTISNQIASLNISLNKRMLVLCTSYKQVKSIANNLLNNNKIDNDVIFMQASKFSKNSILKNYKKSKNSILIGTSTFWEGIDLPRDLLEILVIVRIPFGNPSNPYNKNLSEKIESVGGNPFYDLELPNAILKMKQGVGRLIRSDMDNGICIITDPRICNSGYGKFIINELPVLAEPYYDIDEIIEEIHNFLG